MRLEPQWCHWRVSDSTSGERVVRVCVRALVLLQVRYDLCGEETSLCSQTRFVWRLVSGVNTLGRLGGKRLIGDVSF